MSKIYIARAAFREIQKLSYSDTQKLHSILVSLKKGERSHLTQKLEGYKNLWRTKFSQTDNLRVIWWRQNAEIIVIRARQRKESYEGDLEGISLNNPIVFREDEQYAAEIPRYQWNDEEKEAWFRFVYGNYRYSPVLTQHQRSITNELLQFISIPTEDLTSRTLLIQSAPGTGKTISAALLGCEFSRNYGWNVVFLVPENLCLDIAEYQEVKALSEQDCFWFGTFRQWIATVDSDLERKIATPQQELEAFQRTIQRKHIPHEEDMNLNDVLLYQSFVLNKNCNSIYLENKARIQNLQEIKPEWWRENSSHHFLGLEEELEKLKSIVDQHDLNQLGEITKKDLFLYKTFVVEQAFNNNRRGAIYEDNQKHIQQVLEKINFEWWREYLDNKFCRLDAAYYLQIDPPSPPNDSQRTIFIIDEAQDYLLDELNALIQISKYWQQLGHLTFLWILGDLNQRIQPVDFNWGHLRLGRTVNLLYNYRNSKYILEFANPFLYFAQKLNQQAGGRRQEVPETTPPENAFEEGELIRLVEFASKQEADTFLKKLSEKAQLKQQDERRSVLQELANKIRILHAHDSFPMKRLKNLDFLNAGEAKGREFEAGVAFGLFEGEGQPSLEESLNWYTLLTRIRSRLLVVATTQELARFDQSYFAYCDTSKSEEENIDWITQIAAGSDLAFENSIVEQTILNRLAEKPLQLYWDTYAAFQLAKVEEDRLSQWETEAIELLKEHSLETLEEELEKANQAENPTSLRCLILRAMDRSWQAVEEASQLEKNQPEEYQRLIKSIAQDLETKKLPYEAARVRMNLEESLPTDYPFREKLRHKGSLVSLLCQAIIPEIHSIIEGNHDQYK